VTNPEKLERLPNLPAVPCSVFLSGSRPGESRFRLIYSKTQTDGLKVTFEIGPPGKPEEFSLYVQGAARKKTTGSR